MRTQDLTVSVVIAVRDRPEAIADTLRALARQTRPADEVIVVDAGSRDERTVVAARRAGATVVRFDGPRRFNEALAKNVGLRHASGKVVFILNADILLDRATLAYAVRRHAEEPRLLLQHRRLDAPADLPPALIEEAFEKGELEGLLPRLQARPIDCAGDALSIRRHFLLEVGGHDERMNGWGGLDNDLVWRLQRFGLLREFHAGGPGVGAVHAHHEPSPAGGTPAGRNIALSLTRHPGLGIIANGESWGETPLWDPWCADVAVVRLPPATPTSPSFPWRLALIDAELAERGTTVTPFDLWGEGTAGNRISETLSRLEAPRLLVEDLARLDAVARDRLAADGLRTLEELPVPERWHPPRWERWDALFDVVAERPSLRGPALPLPLSIQCARERRVPQDLLATAARDLRGRFGRGFSTIVDDGARLGVVPGKALIEALERTGNDYELALEASAAEELLRARWLGPLLRRITARIPEGEAHSTWKKKLEGLDAAGVELAFEPAEGEEWE